MRAGAAVVVFAWSLIAMRRHPGAMLRALSINH